MKILLSPAKSLDFNIDQTNLPTSFTTTLPNYKKESSEIMKVLKLKSSQELATMMHLSEDLANLNFQRNKAWKFPKGISEAHLPAAYVFTGEVYRGLNFPTLSDENQIAAQDKIRILSGLYGMLKPMDLIAAYRLEMGTKIPIHDEASNLYQFWKHKLTKDLQKSLAKGEAVINLASTEYSKAIDLKMIQNKVITPLFKDFKNGDYKVIMMYAKHARGAMARYLIENKIEDPEEIKLYAVDNYTFNVNLSTETEWVYTR